MFPTAFLMTVALLTAAAPALTAGAPAAVAQGAPDAQDVLEPVSKTPFPVNYKTPLETRQLALAGTGLRTKTFLHVKVYAMGLYLDAAPAARVLRKWKGRPHAQLVKDGAFYTELLKPTVTKALRLVLLRNIDGEDMREAFEDSLAPRVKRAAREFDMPGGEEALQSFRGHFALDVLKKKTELVFVWFPDGRLVTAIDGKVVGTLRNAALAWALYDVYLGGDPIESEAKRGLVSRVPELLEKTEPEPESSENDREAVGGGAR